MVSLADRWAEIAVGLKTVSESKEASQFGDVSVLLRLQAAAEERFWEEVLQVSTAFCVE